jgi:hypothetical protein
LWPALAWAQYDSAENGALFPDSEERISEDGEANTHNLVDPADLQTTKSYRQGKVSDRHFDETEWKKIVDGVDYSEEEKPVEEEKKENDEGFSIPWSGPLIRMLSYVFVVAIALCLVWFIVQNVSFDLHIQRSKVDDDMENPVENIETLDIQSLLDEAVRAGNFKLAVRLYYLRLLKLLNEAQVIVWKKDKTNRDYLAELFSRDFHFSDIRRLTLFYESVWYGDHMLQAENFQSVRNQFEAVHQRITSEMPS